MLNGQDSGQPRGSGAMSKGYQKTDVWTRGNGEKTRVVGTGPWENSNWHGEREETRVVCMGNRKKQPSKVIRKEHVQ